MSGADPPPLPDFPDLPPKPRDPNDPARQMASKSDMRLLSRATGVVVDFLLTVGVLTAAGWGLDQWQGWGPWGTLGGLGLGLTVGFVRFVREASKLM